MPSRSVSPLSMSLLQHSSSLLVSAGVKSMMEPAELAESSSWKSVLAWPPPMPTSLTAIRSPGGKTKLEGVLPDESWVLVA